MTIVLYYSLVLNNFASAATPKSNLTCAYHTSCFTKKNLKAFTIKYSATISEQKFIYHTVFYNRKEKALVKLTLSITLYHLYKKYIFFCGHKTSLDLYVSLLFFISYLLNFATAIILFDCIWYSFVYSVYILYDLKCL